MPEKTLFQLNIALGLGIGGSAIISVAIGLGDHKKVQRLTTDSLILSVIVVLNINHLKLYHDFANVF